MDYVSKSAQISLCGKYRYKLSRAWKREGPSCVFIGLNPSTADHNEDDPTIRRCVAFAFSWGFSQIVMVNLFAFRATDPKEMKLAQDPVGPVNDDTILHEVQGNLVVAAWGSNGSHLGRDRKVMEMIPGLHCLKINSDGSPAHPLYLKKNLSPIPLQ